MGGEGSITYNPNDFSGSISICTSFAGLFSIGLSYAAPNSGGVLLNCVSSTTPQF